MPLRHLVDVEDVLLPSESELESEQEDELSDPRRLP
eukprot:CAMPEP_0175824568 /NCGR_PEP_ID=MMETSP0107_2-20121207/10794_1 /TAXON_ID=195067 ORGANISM="Goniomonas pacifica, Strain CCMP1869" /NCGR_SAMPLE_ID=MMETSP0107_2 /ASSEMBLY_ACC=CAM_ASM_000203 /LENGTH=35 /DNA_ID= /DNA_START= /DNA_END= /DNA_ORIENTATION=